MHAPSGLGRVTSVCLLPAQKKSRRDHSVALLFSDHIGMRGICDRHRFEIEHSLPLGCDCAFENFVHSSAERWFHDTSSAFRRLRQNSPCKGPPSVDTIEKVPCSLLSPMYKFRLAFLAFSIVIVLSRFVGIRRPCRSRCIVLW